MDYSTNTVTPRPPKHDQDVWDKIERIIKVLTQGVALIGLVGGGLFTVISYGGKAMKYIIIGIEANNKAKEGANKAKGGAGTEDEKSSGEENNGSEDDAVKNEIGSDDSAEIDNRPEYYRLTKRGNQLYKLAEACDMSQEEIEDLNPQLEDPDFIVAGKTKILLKGKRYHLVKKGHRLRVVAKMYNVTLAELMEANHKKRNYVKVGEKLIIPHHISNR